MSTEASVQTRGGLEGQPPMAVRRQHDFIYCPRLFYYQWAENIFQENAGTIEGSHAHRNIDKWTQREISGVTDPGYSSLLEQRAKAA